MFILPPYSFWTSQIALINGGKKKERKSWLALSAFSLHSKWDSRKALKNIYIVMCMSEFCGVRGHPMTILIWVSDESLFLGSGLWQELKKWIRVKSGVVSDSSTLGLGSGIFSMRANNEAISLVCCLYHIANKHYYVSISWWEGTGTRQCLSSTYLLPVQILAVSFGSPNQIKWPIDVMSDFTFSNIPYFTHMPCIFLSL